MILTWLEATVSSWRQRIEQQRVPHAVLLVGPAGTGKRALAVWMANEQLRPGLDDGPGYPLQVPERADLHWLAPPEDRRTIGVDQIRALVSELNLTSYEGGGKVAIIEPANAMTTSAANGLLKTLEEPPGNALLILVADRVSHLPATILSRCQRINVNCPGISESLQWLASVRQGANWPAALQAAAGCPLLAIDALERLEETDGMSADLRNVAEHSQSPLAVAARWAKMEPNFVLDWLSGQVQNAIRTSLGGANMAASPVASQSVLQRMDTRNLFCYLDTINRLRAQAAGSFNVQLTFESLLIDWAQGLMGAGRQSSMQEARMPEIGR